MVAQYDGPQLIILARVPYARYNERPRVSACRSTTFSSRSRAPPASGRWGVCARYIGRTAMGAVAPPPERRPQTCHCRETTRRRARPPPSPVVGVEPHRSRRNRGLLPPDGARRAADARLRHHLVRSFTPRCPQKFGPSRTVRPNGEHAHQRADEDERDERLVRNGDGANVDGRTPTERAGVPRDHLQVGLVGGERDAARTEG